MYQIYRIHFANDESYVGQTRQGIALRCRPICYKYNKELLENFEKYPYTIEVLAETEDKDEANELEYRYIQKYGNTRLNKEQKPNYYRELCTMKHKIKNTGAELTVFNAFQDFIQEKEANNLSEATIRNYQKSFGLFCEYAKIDLDTPFEEIAQDLIFQWIGHMRKEEISVASINHYLRDVRAFFNWCKKRDYNNIDIKELKQQEEQPKFFKDDDIEKLLEKPRPKDSFVEWRTWAMVNTVLATGARAATLCNMKVTDIDFIRKEIALAHTKNKKAQIIPLSATLEGVLKEYTKKFGLTNYLFPNIGDEQLTSNAISHAFSKYCEDREVEQTNIHGLRHSFARSWIKNGGSAFALQKILGHQQMTMTQRYVKLYSDDLKEGYEDFSPLDNIKKKNSRTSKFKK